MMPVAADRKSDMLIKQQTMELLPKVDAIVFDVDGVIVDVSGTFRVVICEAAQFYCEKFLGFESAGRLLNVPEVESFKNAGGFNNDWDLCSAVVLLYVVKSLKHETRKPSQLRELSPTIEEYTEEVKRRGGGLQHAEELLVHELAPEQRRELSMQWNQKLITQVFQELYAGDEHCERLYGFTPEYHHGAGLAEQEPVLLDLKMLPRKLRLGLLTGRTLEETRFAIGRAGLTQLIPESHWVTHDDGVHKPNGRALWMAADRMQFQLAIYIGDTVDDLRTVINYRELKASERAKVIAALVLSGPAGAANRDPFLERGAEIVAPDVNAILAFLQARQ